MGDLGAVTGRLVSLALRVGGALSPPVPRPWTRPGVGRREIRVARGDDLRPARRARKVRAPGGRPLGGVRGAVTEQTVLNPHNRQPRRTTVDPGSTPAAAPKQFKGCERQAELGDRPRGDEAMRRGPVVR